MVGLSNFKTKVQFVAKIKMQIYAINFINYLQDNQMKGKKIKLVSIALNFARWKCIY